MRRARTCSLVAAVLLGATSISWAAPGDLDPTFDGDGILTTTIGAVPSGFGGGPASDAGQAVAVQPDGRIVVAGFVFVSGTNRFAVARYNDDGTLDTNFDGDGIVTTAVSTDRDIPYGVAIQSDGRIIVAGTAQGASNPDVALVRYNGDGSLDTNFDGDGIAITAIPDGSGTQNDSGRGVVVDDASGKILLFWGKAPAGGLCDGKTCWKTLGATGIKFRLENGTPDGTVAVDLKAGAAGKSKAQVKGKGVQLSGRLQGLPAPALPLPLRAQLQAGNGECWEATYSTTIKNEPGLFKAKGD